MSSYVTLIGAEDVQRAGNRMSEAASEMSRAASNISAALEQHQRFMDDWLQRLDGTLADRARDIQQALS